MADAADVDTPLRFLPGIGPAKAAALSAAGLATVWDVLHAPPRSQGPPPPLVEDGPLREGESARVRGRLVGVRPIFRRGQRGMALEAKLQRADGEVVPARFWNAGWLRRHLIANEWYLFEGTVRQGALAHPAFTHLAGGAAQAVPEESGCRTSYRLPEGFSERAYAALVEACLARAERIGDPAGELDAAAYAAVLRALHRPPDPVAHERARRVVAARELLAVAVALQRRRARVVGAPGRAWSFGDEIERRALARLPFALTPGQLAALAEIREDLRAREPMYRLLQGDVGSGKTALALIAALAVIADGAQAALLAPTAVLARQHHAFCARCLAGSRVRLGLLTGGTTAPERRALIADLAAKRVDLLIGTHALIEDDVRFADLGLVIVDEQHKFGVAQRAALVAKAWDDAAASSPSPSASGPPGGPDAAGAGGGETATAAALDGRPGRPLPQGEAATDGRPGRPRQQAGAPHARPHPDLLLMTATPIPRTLALTAFGDLAVSRIAGKPPGRAAVTTELRRWTGPRDLAQPIAETVAGGGRAFVICPLREESEAVDAADATSIADGLAGALGARVALMTGAMTEGEKVAALDRFQRGDAVVLVSTTVVEVGIDVPAATLMAVLDAPRFGLAQLHQLRGRIGRGALPGRCLLYHRDDDGAERLRVLAASDDGLAIAEADLAERGPGQLLGTDQHGLPRLRVADLARDLDLLQDAHARARELLRAGEPPAALARFIGQADGEHAVGG